MFDNNISTLKFFSFCIFFFRNNDFCLLIIKHDVRQPYMFRRHVQSFDAAVVVGVPLQLVIVPFLQQTKSELIECSYIYQTSLSQVFYFPKTDGKWLPRVTTRYIIIMIFKTKLNLTSKGTSDDSIQIRHSSASTVQAE